MLPINQIICGDNKEIMQSFPDESIDMIFTDPPYGKEGIYLYELIAKEAARILKPGKFAIFYASDYWMPQTFIPICNYLDYFMLFHVLNDGSHNSVHPKKLFQGAKSIWAFTKEKPNLKKWISNLVPRTKREKSHRKDSWEQSTGQSEYFINAYSDKDDVILDPCCGSGTTCVAAKKLGRKFIGIDISQEQIEMSNLRLKELDTAVPVKEQKIGQMSLWK